MPSLVQFAEAFLIAVWIEDEINRMTMTAAAVLEFIVGLMRAILWKPTLQVTIRPM